MYNIVHMNCSAILPHSPWQIYCERIQQYVRPLEQLKTCARIIMTLTQHMQHKYHLNENESRLTVFDVLTRSSGTGLFPLHSQMNHRCLTPNVRIEFNNNNNNNTNANNNNTNNANNTNANNNSNNITKRGAAVMDVIAQREIQEGEEICIDYVGFSQQQPHHQYKDNANKTKRQQILWESFGFVCYCSECVNE